jgi:hypothetical protein
MPGLKQNDPVGATRHALKQFNLRAGHGLSVE